LDIDWWRVGLGINYEIGIDAFDREFDQALVPQERFEGPSRIFVCLLVYSFGFDLILLLFP